MTKSPGWVEETDWFAKGISYEQIPEPIIKACRGHAPALDMYAELLSRVRRPIEFGGEGPGEVVSRRGHRIYADIGQCVFGEDELAEMLCEKDGDDHRQVIRTTGNYLVTVHACWLERFPKKGTRATIVALKKKLLERADHKPRLGPLSSRETQPRPIPDLTSNQILSGSPSSFPEVRSDRPAPPISPAVVADPDTTGPLERAQGRTISRAGQSAREELARQRSEQLANAVRFLKHSRDPLNELDMIETCRELGHPDVEGLLRSLAAKRRRVA
jgi:hypothetical protein